MLSPEDVAWADSCLATDTLENGWDSLQDALLEALSAQSISSVSEKDNSYEEVIMRFSASTEETVQTDYLNETMTNTPGSSKRDETDSNGESKDENPDDFWSRHKVNDVFLPTYNEDLKDLGLSDPDMDFTFQASEPEQTASDIFKVWDLNFPPLEEDDLFKQMDKPIAQSSSGPLSSANDDAQAMKDLKDLSVDDLISGIADLTLRPS